MHSNVVSNTDPNQYSSSQISSNQMSNGNPNGLLDNNSLILSHENMFGISSSPNSVDVNQPPSFVYSEHPMQQQLQGPTQGPTQGQAHVRTETQLQTQSEAQGQSSQLQQPQTQLMHELMDAQGSLEHHPVVPSQRTINHQHTAVTQNQRTMEEEQERVAAAAQQVMAQQMAQQYVMMQQHSPSEHMMQSPHQMMVMNNEALQPAVPSQETPHVVLSQMSILSPSSPSTSVVNSMHQIKGNPLSLHNAVVQQQHQIQYDPMYDSHGSKRPATCALDERKKSRRHTVSNGTPPVLNIDTKNLPFLSSSPRSAAVTTQQGIQYQSQPFTRSEERQAFIDEQKKSLGTIDIPPPPTLQELGIVQSGGLSAKDYDGLSRAQLISRLIELENEKLSNEQHERMAGKSEMADEESTASPSTLAANQELSKVSVAPEEDKSTVDGEEEEEEGSEVSEEQTKTQKIQCKWRDCGLFFDSLQKLIAHINGEHVKSGKPSYSCEWENCSRNEKPFTKRHKMYNHLRTHTGERPFVCTEEGCGKKFSRPDSLTTHVKTHSNVRPYSCPYAHCGKAYYHARSLKKHEKSHETALSTNNNSIQFSTSASSTPFGSLTGHTDYLSSQSLHSQSFHSQSLPNSPHLQQNFSVQQSKPYTPPNNLLSFSPAGMVEQQQGNEHLVAQSHQLLDSVNQQHGSF